MEREALATSLYAGFIVLYIAGREELVKKSVISGMAVRVAFAMLAVITMASCSGGVPGRERKEAVRGRLDLRDWRADRQRRRADVHHQFVQYLQRWNYHQPWHADMGNHGQWHQSRM